MQTEDTVQSIIDKEIDKVYQARKAKKKVSDRFSASDAGYCQRAATLNRLNAKRTEPDSNGKRLMWLGQVIHDGLFALIEKSGQMVSKETFLKAPDSFVWGAEDIVYLDYSGKHVLNEIKSIHTGKFWSKVKKNQFPILHNVYQAVTYYMLRKALHLRTDKVEISYVSKQDMQTRSFPIEITEKLISDVTVWWNSVNEYWLKRELPPKVTEDTESDQYELTCKNCSFKPYYCFPQELSSYTPESIQKNILGLKWTNEEVKQQKDEEEKKALELHAPKQKI